MGWHVEPEVVVIWVVVRKVVGIGGCRDEDVQEISCFFQRLVV